MEKVLPFLPFLSPAVGEIVEAFDEEGAANEEA